MRCRKCGHAWEEHYLPHRGAREAMCSCMVEYRPDRRPVTCHCESKNIRLVAWLETNDKIGFLPAATEGEGE